MWLLPCQWVASCSGWTACWDVAPKTAIRLNGMVNVHKTGYWHYCITHTLIISRTTNTLFSLKIINCLVIVVTFYYSKFRPIQLQLRWNKGDLISFYQFTGYFLTPLLAEVEKMLLLCSDYSHLESCKTDLTAFVNRVFGDIVNVLSNGANAYVPTYRKHFFKF